MDNQRSSHSSNNYAAPRACTLQRMEHRSCRISKSLGGRTGKSTAASADNEDLESLSAARVLDARRERRIMRRACESRAMIAAHGGAWRDARRFGGYGPYDLHQGSGLPWISHQRGHKIF